MIGKLGSVRHLVPTVEVEMLDIDLTVETEEVREADRSSLQEKSSAGIKVCRMKKTFRGTRKAYIMLEEARALKLLKVAHIKIGWVSCRVRRKTETNRCYPLPWF